MASKKDSKKGGKKNPKQKKEEEPAPDLLEKDGEALHLMITQLRDRVIDLKGKRNYAEQERDHIETFYTNVRGDVDDHKIKITTKDTEAQHLEDNHRVEVKVYEQKVKYLQYDQKLKNIKTNDDGNKALKAEDDHHDERLNQMQDQKHKQKRRFNDKEKENQEDVKQQQQQQDKMMKKQKMYYDGKIDHMINYYEEHLRKLREELELKLRVEVHEIEERKNQHINELMRNHEAAFAELKSYYNDITRENLNVIKQQRQDIENLGAQSETNSKQITEIKAKNKKAEEPLKKNRKLRDDMKYALKQHEKDKMSLANLKLKQTALREKIRRLEKEQEDLDQKYERVLQEKRDFEERFERITEEIRGHADLKNEVLSKRLLDLENQLEYKEAQLHQLVQRASIDPNIVNQLLVRVQQSIEGKNAVVKNLRYSIHHATKAYNDAIRVYESKLTQFGVPADELGFQLQETKTSTMPAGLVAS